MTEGIWRTVRVVVEVPVRGKFTEKDLSWSVDRALMQDGFWQDIKYLPEASRPIFGKIRVKEYGRHMAALRQQTANDNQSIARC